jgi:hypothetical protein
MTACKQTIYWQLKGVLKPMLISTPLPTAQLTVLQQSVVVLSPKDLPLAHTNRRCRCTHTHRDRISAAARMLLRIKPKAPLHRATAFAEQFWNTQHPPRPEFDLKIC